MTPQQVQEAILYLIDEYAAEAGFLLSAKSFAEAELRGCTSLGIVVEDEADGTSFQFEILGTRRDGAA